MQEVEKVKARYIGKSYKEVKDIFQDKRFEEIKGNIFYYDLDLKVDNRAIVTNLSFYFNKDNKVFDVYAQLKYNNLEENR